MKLLTPALLAATALSVTLPTVAEAQSYNARSYQGGNYQDCETSRQNRQIAGALIGGVLGAVIGNELADDSNNNRHGRHDRWDRRGRWDNHGRYGRGYYGRHDRRYRHRDRGNAEEVGTIAGAGVGALIGAGIAGGEDCGTVRRTGGGYAGKPDGYYGDSGYYQDDRYYGNDAGYSDDPYYDDRYDSSGDLLGGPDRGEPARTYSASSTYSNASATGHCQWSQTRRIGEYGQAVTDRVWMCQGADGIWRPADTYGQ